jgi:hypothetical protein
MISFSNARLRRFRVIGVIDCGERIHDGVASEKERASSLDQTLPSPPGAVETAVTW